MDCNTKHLSRMTRVAVLIDRETDDSVAPLPFRESMVKISKKVSWDLHDKMKLVPPPGSPLEPPFKKIKGPSGTPRVSSPMTPATDKMSAEKIDDKVDSPDKNDTEKKPAKRATKKGNTTVHDKVDFSDGYDVAPSASDGSST